jgi:riboflavin kinase / FMN adenylyltransferase
MRVHFGLPQERLGPTVLTIGSFDGVHIGHRAVLSRVVDCARAEGMQAAWITFEPHPRCVLDPANCPQQITTLEEKAALVGPLGFDHAIVLEFTRELASLSADDFMSRLLASVELRHLIVGYDFALGRGRAGTVAWLAEHGRDHGYGVRIEQPVGLNEEEVHSSDVRRLITLGQVERASKLLGRPFSMSGLVEPGDRIGGKVVGFPTVNLGVPPGKLVPGLGIYAGYALTPMGEREAAISVGYRPTFGKTELRVEAYLLDFDGDLYQRRIELRFVARLRDELRFSGPEELAEAIAKDVEDTRRILSDHRSDPPG